ncbi:MAG: energy transducer TonB [Bacteroidota bacterium]
MPYPRYFLLFLFALSSTLPNATQAQSISALPYEVNQVLPHIWVTKKQAVEAATLMDVNPRFKPAWVRRYLAVECSAVTGGVRRTAIGKSARLTEEQKELMLAADAGTDIRIVIDYIPENSLKEEEPKQIDFDFYIQADQAAQYPGGKVALQAYLKEQAIQHIPAGIFEGYDFAAVTFTVSELGEITAVELFESSKNEVVDNLLLDAVRKMPCWEPARYSNGVQTAQTFAFTIGNMENCMVNLLNIEGHSVTFSGGKDRN